MRDNKIELGIYSFICEQMLLSKRYETFKICDENGSILSEFEGAKKAGKCLPGDFVIPEEGGCSLKERAEHPPLVGIVEFSSKIKYGYSGRNNPIYLFKPFDDRYPPFLVGSKETTRANQIGIAAFDDWDTGATFPRASLQKLLGPCGKKEVELEAVAYQYSPWLWTKKQLNQPFSTIPYSLIESRYDLRDKSTINIDPEGCRDIDDCISLWKEGEKWFFAISIADVAAFLEHNPILFKHAAKIGQTLYLDGKVIRPLLPPVLSENALSLVPGDEKNTITLLAEWNGTNLDNFSWKLARIVNKASYTYENCYDAKEIDMNLLAKISSSLVGHEERDSHKWIESFMILYNERAALTLLEMKSGFLRCHSQPDRERFAQFERIGLPGKELAFPAAVYCETGAENIFHFGLEKSAYCHASSPIRRFPDILNQFILHSHIRGSPETFKATAFQLNLLMKNGKGFERDCHFIQTLFDKNTLYEKGIIVSEKEVYIPAWKRICKHKNAEKKWEVGQEVRVGFYVNMNERNWKQRIIIRLDELLNA